MTSLMMIFFIAFIVSASVIYKDISSISIRTNFDLDYETIKSEGTPDITYNSEGLDTDMVYVYSTAKYEIESVEWYTQSMDEFEIGGMPKVSVYLVTKEYPYYNYNSNNDYYYRFMSSYSSSSCYISNGTFVSATRLSNSNLKVVFALKGLKGTYNEPENAYWENEKGVARWEPSNVSDSGYYDLILYRDSSVVARVDKYKGNTYNFANYFTKAGDYSFKVRTVPGTDNQSTYGKNSEYVESGYVAVDDTLIAQIKAGGYGNINNSGSTNVGWIQLNNTWYFYKPNGEQVRNGWISWNNNWYYFGNEGTMLTGMQTINNMTYYLGTDGTMITGWINLNDTYYYFDTTNGNNYGAMLINSWIKYDNKYFYFDEKGIMVTGWKQVNDGSGNTGYYYFYPKGTTQGLYGYMAQNCTINGFQIGSDGKWIQK